MSTYTPTPPYQPGQPPGQPATNPRRRLPWILGGLAVLLACCVGGTAIVASGGGDDGKPKNRIDAAVSGHPVTTTQPALPPPTATAAAPATPQAPAAPKPKVYTGRGDKVLKVGELTDIAILQFDCTRCSANTIVESDGPEGLLINEIGSYKGKRWLNVENDALTTRLTIKASGKWTARIGTVAALATKAPTGKASGKGDDVVVLNGTADVYKITHKGGSGNFVVYAYNLDSGEGGLLVNEIGGYSGEQALQAPALVQVTADGSWTLTPA